MGTHLLPREVLYTGIIVCNVLSFIIDNYHKVRTITKLVMTYVLHCIYKLPDYQI